MNVNREGKKENNSVSMSSSDRKNGENKTMVRLVSFIDVLAVTIVFSVIWMNFYLNIVYADPFASRGRVVVVLLYAVLYGYLAHIYQGFSLHISRISEMIFSQVLAAIFANAIMYVVTILLARRLPNIMPMLCCLFFDLIVISFWAQLAHKWYFKKYAKKKTVIIYDELEGMESLIRENGLDARYDVIDVIPIKKIRDDNLARFLLRAEIVFLCSIHSHERNQIVKYCVAHDIKAYVVPRIGDVIMSGAEKAHVMHMPMLLVGRYDPNPEYLAVKRFFDIVLSGLALVVLSPLMITLALIIRRDGGTAFYRQVRLTKDGKKFEILKFRSMCMNAEKDGVARLSSGENDPRITKVGKFIRACRMDELPQLINILKGDMSIVGPRPERPEIAEQYEKSLPEFRLRLQCKCGLTGYAQVFGKYNSTPYEKLLMDLMYIAKPSIAEDIKIIFATVKVLFMKESTEGVAEGQTTAERTKRPDSEEEYGERREIS